MLEAFVFLRWLCWQRNKPLALLAAGCISILHKAKKEACSRTWAWGYFLLLSNREM